MTDVRLETGSRVVTFANGMVVQLIVDLDEERQRLAYAAVGDMFQHHHASMQVIPEGQDRYRLLWIPDLLPDEAAKAVRSIIDEGAIIMKRTLEREDAA